MPWWATLYAAIIGVLCAAGAIGDARARARPAWHIALDIVAGVLLIIFIVARWHGQLVAPLGKSVTILFATMLMWDIYSTSRDLADIEHDPELTSRENAWVERGAILIGALVIAPAYALALMSVVTAWRGAA
jgi:hypothetical protein